jgi:hypothetical protein
MKIFKRVLSGIFFVPLILIFLVLTSLIFQVLNSSYLFSAFERNSVYEKIPTILAESIPNDPNIPEDERDDYAAVVGSIKPEQSKRLLQGFLVPVLDFVHGETDDIKISVSPSELGFSGGANIEWSLSKNPPSETLANIKLLAGVWDKLLLAWFLLILVLGGLVFLGGRMVLLIGGIFVLLVGVSLRIFLFVVAGGMPTQAEPSQRLLGFLASTLLPEIVVIWLGVGVIFILIWGVLRKVRLLD